MKIIIFTAILFLSIKISAQLNGDVGYSLAYVNAAKTNALIDYYNAKGTNKLKDMKPLHLLDGFNIGAAYRMGLWKAAIYWENLSSALSSVEGDIDQNRGLERKLYFYMNSLSGAVEFQYSHIGFGVSAGYNYFSIKTAIDGTESKIALHKENFYSSKIYLIFYARGSDILGVALKPYVRLPWSESSVDAVHDFLQIDKPFNTKEKFIQFGITFTISNGPQPDY